MVSRAATLKQGRTRAAERDEWRTAPPTPLHRLRPREMWNYFKVQPWSFKLICLYVFFEYVRPQAVYPALNGMQFASWTVLAAGAAFIMEGRRFRPLGTLDWLLGLFTLVVIASSLTAYWPGISFDRFVSTYFSWVIIYLLITNIVDNEKKFIVFMLLYFLWCLKMSQFGARMVVMRGFSFSSWGLTCAPQFFHNSGECGIQLAMFYISSLYFLLGIAAYVTKRTKWIVAILPISAAIAVMGSSSRGAQLSLATIMVWMVLRSRRPIRTLFGVAIAGALLFSILPEEQKDRFRTMGTDETSMTRRQYWSDGIKILNEHPVLGVGFQNWLPYYLRYYNAKGQLSHNIFVEAGAELGYVGLSAFVLLIIGTLVVNARTRRIARRLPRGHFLWCMAHGLDGALIAYLVGGFFVTVLYYPFFWINLAMTATLHHVARRTARAAGGVPGRVPRRGRPPVPRAGHAT